MLDTTALGKRILSRRKAQGLTQEQLGSELGVSGQSVSKWENGETTPDIGLMPDLCRVLGISSDALLGIDGGAGIESLGSELARRIGELRKPERTEAFIQAMKSMVLLGNKEVETPWSSVTENHMAYEWKTGHAMDVRVLRNGGLACFVTGDIIDAIPTPEDMERLRILLAQGKWELALLLTKGPRKERDILREGLGPDDEVVESLSAMVDAGLLKVDKDGYKLNEFTGLPWTSVIRALCTDLQAAAHSVFFNSVP